MAAAAASAAKAAEEQQLAPESVFHRYYVLGENGPQTIKDVFDEQGWLPFVEGESPYWNLEWRGTRFRQGEYESCQPWQRLNHFPKTLNLTRKDTLYRLLRTMRGIYGSIYDYVPLTFSLPNDYTKFVKVYAHEEERRNQGMWICKPADQSRGRGIFVFKHLTELAYDCNAVLQRYIPNPLLISGYKFDMRCYVVVKSYNPLVIFVNDEGLARFATHSPSLGHEKEDIGAGCRWTFARLREWFKLTNRNWDVTWKRILGTIIVTLLPVAADVPPVPAGCFELYGFDVLVDETLKPWLLEVNFGPALSLDSEVDYEVKKPLLADIIDIVDVTDEQLALAYEASVLAKQARRKPRVSSACPSKTQRTTTPSLRRHVKQLHDVKHESVEGLTPGKPAFKGVIQETKKAFLI
ncbi:tubulin-tyrosine ligase family-domain-containing protein [Fimicolochytrium jonesii]|uniref:tubulin-tyrosine ligase family-domain-containing protein n=1 Tax=Fimicolochytrium jonesii TaxID=1396493 RepID=UPI0022FDCF92|nr:tubulin-tyrosine ligase family-domain-containing protein [Fimicolochytrium jonesii]KAI8822506.1 tubulin-tyrosine ligase family-domain-containing protein [Fimicolochytrium jonesii]